jgi:hypothetical protein
MARTGFVVKAETAIKLQGPVHRDDAAVCDFYLPLGFSTSSHAKALKQRRSQSECAIVLPGPCRTVERAKER